MKKLLIALLLLTATPAQSQTVDIPTWFTRYKELRHHALHYVDRYKVMSLRLRIATARCKDLECIDKAYAAWRPAIVYIEQSFMFSVQMSDIVHKFCESEESIPTCVVMVKGDSKYISESGGFDMWIYELYRQSRMLVKIHQNFRRPKTAPKSNNAPGQPI